MNELISQLTASLGISAEQAKGGLGTVLNMAKEKLAGGEFEKVTAAVGDGADDAMALAESKTQSGGGGGLMDALGGLAGGPGGLGASLGGALGGMGGALGGMGGPLGDLGKLAGLAKGFSAFSMDSNMIAKFLPIVLSFCKQRGGEGLSGILSKLM